MCDQVPGLWFELIRNLLSEKHTNQAKRQQLIHTQNVVGWTNTTICDVNNGNTLFLLMSQLENNNMFNLNENNSVKFLFNEGAKSGTRCNKDYIGNRKINI